MGLTKQYLKYQQDGSCNIIASTWPGFSILNTKKSAMLVTGACEDIIIWDLRILDKYKTLQTNMHVQVTSFSVDITSNFIAVGFINGSIKIYDSKTFESDVTFNGHKNAISCLNFDKDAVRLVSGGMDTDIVIWSIFNESGLFRLKGHTGPITQAMFLNTLDALITCSKDTLLKFWDLKTQHCFKTIVDHTTEIYDLLLLKNESILVTGCADMQLRFWKLTFIKDYPDDKTKKFKYDDNFNDAKELELLELSKLGSLSRSGKGHLMTLVSSTDGLLFGCHGTDRKIEIFRIVDEEEIIKHLKKREKKRKLKNANTSDIIVERVLEDEIKRLVVLKMSHAVRTFRFLETSPQKLLVISLLRNNSFDICEADISSKPVKRNSNVPIISEVKSCFSLFGHKSHVKNVIFSSDATMFATLSIDSLRLWNRMSLQCIRSMECSNGVCCIFVLENRRIIVGTMSGQLNMFDIASGSLVESFDAHDSCCNALFLATNKLGFVSGGSDRMLIFWNLEFPKQNTSENKMLTIKAEKRIEVADEILCISYSSDQKFIAVGCLDRKAYIFFADTMKMFHTLYSHNQPVTCLDISTDTTIIATGSGDKDIKIWSMDFGECRKIIKVAHDDRISALKFIPKTHMFFTSGFDGNIKQWDADTFKPIITLKGLPSRINSLSISPLDGKFIVACFEDHSVRLWSKTDEILVADEEQEMNREAEAENEIREHLKVPGELNEEVGIAGMKTSTTLDAVEKLYEALNVFEDDQNKLKEFEELKSLKGGRDLKRPKINILFKSFNVETSEEYVMEVVKKIKSSELEETLIVLPFSSVPQFLALINICMRRNIYTELVSRCLFFLLRIHTGQILSSQSCVPILDCLRDVAPKHLQQIQDTIGFNLAGLNFLKARIEEKNSLTLFGEAFQKHKNNKKKRNRAVLTIRT